MADDIVKRTFTIPLRRGFANTPRYKRTNKAVRVLRKYLVKHMKSEKVKLGPQLNDVLWENGIKNPPHKVTVVATRDKENVVRAELVGHEYVDFKQQEKVEKPKNLQERLKQTVADAKAGKADKEQKNQVEKTETKATTDTAKVETTTKTAEKPKEKEVTQEKETETKDAKKADSKQVAAKKVEEQAEKTQTQENTQAKTKTTTQQPATETKETKPEAQEAKKE